MQGFGGENLLLFHWLLVVGNGVILVAVFFFLQHLFWIASRWVGGGFPSNLFQVSSGPPLFLGRFQEEAVTPGCRDDPKAFYTPLRRRSPQKHIRMTWKQSHVEFWGSQPVNPWVFLNKLGGEIYLQLEAPSTWARPFKQLHP